MLLLLRFNSLGYLSKKTMMNIYVVGHLFENYSAICTYQVDVYMRHGSYVCVYQGVRNVSFLEDSVNVLNE